MNATSIAIKVASLVFSGGILIILFKKIKSLKRYGLVSVIYVLLTSLLLALPTLLNMFGLSYSEIFLLVTAQLFILFLGIMHVVLVPSTLLWYKVQTFNMQLLFIFAILFLAFFFCNMSLTDLQKHQLPLVWYLSLLWFLIPVLLKKTIDEFLNVPTKVYKLWHYYVGQNIEDPSDEELANPIVISFIFRKNVKSEGFTTFRAKAPINMTVGRLFYYFINDYNDRHPEGAISYRKDTNEPYGWIFEKPRIRLLGLNDVIDPDSSVYINELRENDVLYCHRIYQND